MQHRWSPKRRTTWALLAAPALAVASLSVATASNAAAPRAHHAPAAATERYVASQFNVAPNSKYNMLDCNGWGTKYKPVAPHMRELCTDPHGVPYQAMDSAHCAGAHYGGGLGRFIDNCHYVGHDEPSVKFISSAPGSGYQMTYYMQLPTDPSAAPTDTGSVVHYFELSPAPWFGLPICDPASYGQRPCTPHSDKNIGAFDNSKVAGSAFMELQFYPPGETPFADNVSCSLTKWCSALTIDSLESKFDFVGVNENCAEPVNFSYLQTNGVPAGPPSPQKTNNLSFTPNAHTLEMNDGDVLKVSISDPLTGRKAGFTTTVTDLTTGQTGYMIASARNGFMNTNYKTCKGHPFTFHAEYNTAKKQNQVPWAALEGGVLMEQETGHSEVCTSVANTDPTSLPGVSDPQTADTCDGGSEGPDATGEGPCDAETGICTGSETEGPSGPQACPSDSFDSPVLCEYADATCIPQGNRSVTLNGHSVTIDSPVNFCQANRYQNGDLDFDGIPYQATTWPNGTADNPTSLRYAGPFLKSGGTYSQIQFETDIPGSEFLCDTGTGADCDVPPIDAAFYPYWSLTNKVGIGTLFPAGACIWNFGNSIPSVTTEDFGGDAQYGSTDLARPFGTNISRVYSNNPEVSGSCPALHAPQHT